MVNSFAVKYLDGKPMHKSDIKMKYTNKDCIKHLQIMFEKDCKEKYCLVFTSNRNLPEYHEIQEIIKRYMRMIYVFWNLNDI